MKPDLRGKDHCWPEIKSEQRPWTPWWWIGYEVDTRNISRLLRVGFTIKELSS